jgi:hypothetical protein
MENTETRITIIESKVDQIKMDILSIGSKVDERYRGCIKDIDKLKESYTNHDISLIRVATSIEGAIKEFTLEKLELVRMIDRTQRNIEMHLEQEDTAKDKLIDKFFTVGWTVLTAGIIAGAALIFKTLKG